jgi:hypothetical protein
MSMRKSLRRMVLLGALGAGAACGPTQGPAPGVPPPGTADPIETPPPPTPGGPTTPACGAAVPGKRYIGHSADECSRIRFACDAGEEYFSDECGCGCQKTGAAPGP